MAVIMLSKQQLEKLSKAEIVSYALNLSDLHVKFDALENSFIERVAAIEKEFSDQLNDYKRHNEAVVEELKSQLEISKNTSAVLRDNLSKKERQGYRSAEYLNYETLEISKIPLTIPDADVQNVTLQIINTLYSDSEEEFGLDDVHAIHRRQGNFCKEKVLVKFVRRGDAFQTLKRAKKLREIDLKVIDERLVEKVYINEHLSPYYSKLRYICKLLRENKSINDFWVSGHKIKIKTTEDDVKIISHKNDLIKFASGEITNILTNV